MTPDHWRNPVVRLLWRTQAPLPKLRRRRSCPSTRAVVANDIRRAPMAAQQQPAAAPIQVGAPQQLSPERPISLEANDSLVLATPFLAWRPAAAAAGATPRVELPQNQLFAVFGRRCSFTKQAGQRALLDATNSMQFGITTAAWSRVLTALRDSGLLAASFNSKRSLARAIKVLTIANAADLVIDDSDLDLGESGRQYEDSRLPIGRVQPI